MTTQTLIGVLQTLARVIQATILFFVIAACIMLTSCASVRKTKDKHESKTEVTEMEQTKTKTVTTEKVDTTVAIKGDTAIASKPIDDFIKGDTIEAETNGTKVKAWYDPISRKVHAQGITEDKQVPIVVNKTTTTESDNKRTVETEEQTKVSHSETVRPPLWYSAWFWLIMIILAAAAYLIWRYKPPFL